MQIEHEQFMELALREAEIALTEGNPPYGCVVVRDGQVIARGHNLAISTTDVTAHAETAALRNGGSSGGLVDFSGCTMYATFEPCAMCCGALIVANISTLVIGGRTDRTGSSRGYSVEALLELTGRESDISVIAGVLKEKCEAIRNRSRT